LQLVRTPGISALKWEDTWLIGFIMGGHLFYFLFNGRTPVLLVLKLVRTPGISALKWEDTWHIGFIMGGHLFYFLFNGRTHFLFAV
jgi:hypothetical protein